MKYYINNETGLLLIDPNEYTSYLEEKGYEEITEEKYNEILQEQEEQYKLEHPEEFEDEEIGEQL